MSSQPKPQAIPHLASVPPEFCVEERRLLLELVHRTVEVCLAGRRMDTVAPTAHLAQRRGAFTTLHVDDRLRGCVGYVLPAYSLYRTVAETAMAAAFNDPRFGPVGADEIARLRAEVSVLSPLQRASAEEIAIGIHGLVITMGLQRGLLLPQVPLEHGWDCTTFLQQTCLKAGLAPDSWKCGATIETFTAEVFTDENTCR
jgi:AmmeMemoRadiSam system protein A